PDPDDAQDVIAAETDVLEGRRERPAVGRESQRPDSTTLGDPEMMQAYAPLRVPEADGPRVIAGGHETSIGGDRGAVHPCVMSLFFREERSSGRNIPEVDDVVAAQGRGSPAVGRDREFSVEPVVLLVLDGDDLRVFPRRHLPGQETVAVGRDQSSAVARQRDPAHPGGRTEVQVLDLSPGGGIPDADLREALPW